MPWSSSGSSTGWQANTHRTGQAAWMYVGMVAPGLVTMLCAAAFRPSLWNPQMEGCATMTITTSVVLSAHLVLLTLLPPTVYGNNRAKIFIPVRFLYIASAVYKGLQQCSTVTSWVNGVQTESPFSAFLWRTGIIAMLWHGGAFRLPFHQQLYLQSLAAMAYTMFLAEPVCQSLPAIQHGQHTVLVAHRILQAVGSFWYFMAFIVTGNEALLYGDTVPGPQTRAAAGVGSACMQLGVCLLTVRTWQVIIGHVSLSGLLYYLEARDRRRWRQERLLAVSSQHSQRRQEQQVQQVQRVQRVPPVQHGSQVGVQQPQQLEQLTYQ